MINLKKFESFANSIAIPSSINDKVVASGSRNLGNDHIEEKIKNAIHNSSEIQFTISKLTLDQKINFMKELNDFRNKLLFKFENRLQRDEEDKERLEKFSDMINKYGITLAQIYTAIAVAGFIGGQISLTTVILTPIVLAFITGLARAACKD